MKGSLLTAYRCCPTPILPHGNTAALSSGPGTRRWLRRVAPGPRRTSGPSLAGRLEPAWFESGSSPQTSGWSGPDDRYPGDRGSGPLRRETRRLTPQSGRTKCSSSVKSKGKFFCVRDHIYYDNIKEGARRDLGSFTPLLRLEFLSEMSLIFISCWRTKKGQPSLTWA